MLVLKLIAPILIAIISIVELLINTIWADKRTKKHKKARIGLPILISIMTVLTILIVIDDHKKSIQSEENYIALKSNSEKEIALIEDNSKLTISLAKISDSTSKAEIRELRKVLTPFVKIASKNYPELDTTSALFRLANELESVKEIATKDVFKPFSSTQKEAIKKKLISISKKYTKKPIIKFFIQQGTSNNDKVIKELSLLLNNGGFKTEIQIGLFPRSDISKSWEIHLLSKDGQMIIEILEAIKSYIDPNYGIAQRDLKEWIEAQGKFPDGEVDIFIYGSPNFKNNGQITY